MRAAMLMMVMVGCTGGVDFPGTDMTGFFEFQNNIGYQWEYVSSDISLNYTLVAEIENYLIVDGDTEYTVTYRKDCIGVNDPDCNDREEVRTIIFTSGFAGVRIHEVDGTRYDPPVVLSSQYVKVGESSATTTAGADYTSTLTEMVATCPVRIANWNNCAQFDVVSTPEDPLIVGTYWAVQSFGVIAMDWPGQPGRWELTDHRQVQ